VATLTEVEGKREKMMTMNLASQWSSPSGRAEKTSLASSGHPQTQFSPLPPKVFPSKLLINSTNSY
jgi:hypothetical protein